MGSRIAVSGLRVSGLEVQRVVRGFTYKVCCFKLLVRLFFEVRTRRRRSRRKRISHRCNMRIIRVGFPNTMWDPHEVVQDFPTLKEPHQFNGFEFQFRGFRLTKVCKGFKGLTYNTGASLY